MLVKKKRKQRCLFIVFLFWEALNIDVSSNSQTVEVARHREIHIRIQRKLKFTNNASTQTTPIEHEVALSPKSQAKRTALKVT